MSIDLIYYHTSPAIKIRFPSPHSKGYWAIEVQTHKTTYAVPKLAALIAVSCAKPMKKSDLFSLLSSKVTVNSESFEKVFLDLIQNEIVYSSKDKNQLLENIKKWKDAGWNDAADYHFYTWDTPFLEYTKEGGGHDLDRQRMVDFQQEQPDTFRCKKYSQAETVILFPSFKNLFLNDLKSYSTEDCIKHLLALTFGKISEKQCHWSDVPLIRRTSPSGGCRHPSEGYFIPASHLDIEEGLYHIQTEPAALCLLTENTNQIFESVSIEKADLNMHIGTIIITSVFERNMYRYREPRTFRTIHMDVGHLVGTIEIVAEEIGLRVSPTLNFNENEILQAINASKLEEGVMAVVNLYEGR